jgi:hypothetical protein
MTTLRRSLPAAFALALALAGPARAADPDYSDIWWNAGGAEAGWGVNFAQGPGFIFATFFIYALDGKPQWVTAEMIQTGAGRYGGALYKCTGTYFGIPWVPGNHGCVQAGTSTFVAESVVRGTLTYTVDGTQVVKTIERLALTPIDVGGTYLGGMLIKNSAQCNGGASSSPYAYQLLVTEKANSVVEIAQVTLQGQTDCVMEGTTVQTGRVRTMPAGTYKCNGIEDTTVAIPDMRRTSNGGIELSWTAPLGNGCTETGIFSGTPQQ